MSKSSVWFASLAVAALAVVTACSGDDGDDSHLTSTEQVNNACPATPAILTGTVPAGGACMAAEDCAPSCCSCPGGSEQYLAVSCEGGKCAASSEACSNTLEACD